MYWEIACKLSLSQHLPKNKILLLPLYTWSIKKNVEIMVHDLPVAFVTVHHYWDDNTLLWTTSHISARYPVLRDVVEIPALTID